MSNVIGNYARPRDDNDYMYKAILSTLDDIYHMLWFEMRSAAL